MSFGSDRVIDGMLQFLYEIPYKWKGAARD